LSNVGCSGKQGYIMATQIGQIMHAMEQDFDEKTLRKLIRKFDADGSGKLEFDEFWYVAMLKLIKLTLFLAPLSTLW
jgi:Ca2+-binding EF-hand superfamily protein